jgi:hypothetical protein
MGHAWQNRPCAPDGRRENELWFGKRINFAGDGNYKSAQLFAATAETQIESYSQFTNGRDSCRFQHPIHRHRHSE